MHPSKLPRSLRLSGDLINLYEDAAPGTGAPVKRRRFSMHAYTGKAVHFFGYDMVFDLKGGSAASATPILQQHDPKLIVALSDKVILSDTDGLRFEGYLYDTAASREVQQLADQRFPWQASMGVEPLDVELAEEDRVVNGHQLKAPFIHCHKWQVKESSFVPLGADDATRSLVLADDSTGAIEIRRQMTMSDKKVDPAPDPLVVERKRIADITAAFSDDPTFANKHINLGSSVLEAKAAYADHLKLENEKLKARPMNAPAANPDRGVGAQGGATAMATWDLAVQQAENDLRPRGFVGAKLKFEAIKLADRRNPGLREQYLDEYNLTERPRQQLLRRNVQVK